MSFQVQVQGDERIMRKLANTVYVENQLMDATVKSGVALLKRAQTYPRQRPSTLYRRTGTLGRRWAMKATRNGTRFRATLGNPTEYAPFVQAHTRQALVHKGRWSTDKMMLKEQTQKIIGFYETAVRNIAMTFNRV